MDSLTENKTSSLFSYPFYTWMIGSASFVYIIVSFGLAGIPGVSRLALVSAVFLFISLMLYMGELKFPIWIFTLSTFYAYLLIPAVAIETLTFERIGQLAVVFIGTLSIGLALQNKILSYKVLVYGAIVASIINIAAVHLGVNFHYGVNIGMNAVAGRSSGLVANPNALSITMAFTAFLIWLFPDRFSRTVRSLGIFLAVYGMYITGSRKGLLLVIFLVLMVFMNSLIKLSRAKLIALFSFLAASLFLFYGFILDAAARYGTKIVAVDRLLEALSGKDASFGNRLSMIDIGYNLWEKSPLFGYGFDQFAHLSGIGVYAHNNYIELAVSGGILAILLFYALHLTVLRNALKQRSDLRLRLIIFVAAILIMDTAVISFSSKDAMCVLAILLAVSSGEQIDESEEAA